MSGTRRHRSAASKEFLPVPWARARVGGLRELAAPSCRARTVRTDSAVGTARTSRTAPPAAGKTPEAGPRAPAPPRPPGTRAESKGKAGCAGGGRPDGLTPAAVRPPRSGLELRTPTRFRLPARPGHMPVMPAGEVRAGAAHRPGPLGARSRRAGCGHQGRARAALTSHPRPPPHPPASPEVFTFEKWWRLQSGPRPLWP
ncbi:cuticle collagen 14-like [Prionailurus viverrinus]|uniref:cuticle collagen 14-like n=1 Tax=Prionailurus viverrinus TaxID=61388 RepID=UPI001FF6C657|nr:cuticle collagen 14-like [Prionailurus viverrinus]